MCSTAEHLHCVQANHGPFDCKGDASIIMADILSALGITIVSPVHRHFETFGVDKREKLLPRVDNSFFCNRLRKTFPAKGQAFAKTTREVTKFLAAQDPAAACHVSRLLPLAAWTESARSSATIVARHSWTCSGRIAALDICCGSAAFTTLDKREASLELLVEKMRYASATNAQVIATSNRAAGYSLRASAEMHHANQQALHVIELLDQVNTS
jgi:hypothetical protein